MNSVMQSRIASILTALIGAWLIISPLVIPIAGGALISLFIVGAIFVVAGLVQLVWENTLPSWVNGLAAVWLLISTVVFGVTGAVIWNEVIAAAATFVLATWDGFEVDQTMQHHAHA